MSTLPSFRNPPVVETVLGVQFDPLPELRNAHLGAFWKALGADAWPHLDEQPPLDPQFEEFPTSWAAMAVKVSLTLSPACRLRMRNEARDRMVQVQNGRLHLNWLGGNDAPYPRYSTVRAEFDKLQASFSRFLKDEKLGELMPNQWEVTYVNHIPRGPLWSTPEDWVKVFSSAQGLAEEPSMVALEVFSLKQRYEIQNQRGRLHLEINSGHNSKSGDIIVAKLTARGPVDNSSALGSGLDLGREAIVRTFMDVTSKEAHEHWGYEK